jgi:hypothetical protein
VNLGTSCANLDPGISSRCLSPDLSPSSRTFVELTLVNWHRPWGSRRLDFVIRAGSFNFSVEKISKFCACQWQLSECLNRSHMAGSSAVVAWLHHHRRVKCGWLDLFLPNDWAVSHSWRPSQSNFVMRAVAKYLFMGSDLYCCNYRLDFWSQSPRRLPIRNPTFWIKHTSFIHNILIIILVLTCSRFQVGIKTLTGQADRASARSVTPGDCPNDCIGARASHV